MLLNLDYKSIYLASEPVDFRFGINGLADLIKRDNNTNITDGSVYVFYNSNRDKIKCLFWDGTGFVLYYKKMHEMKFKIDKTKEGVKTISSSQLESLLSGSRIEEDKRPVRLANLNKN